MSTPAEPASAAPRRPSRNRSIGTSVLILLAAFFLLLSTFAIWLNRVALNTDVFVDTSTELIEDDAIRRAVATRAVDELFASVDVQAELKGQLPKNFQGLSGPGSAALREAAYRLVERALEQATLQRLWARSLEQSHLALVEILEGGGDRVSTQEGVVALDLELIILEAAERIGIRDQVEDNLPADVGRIEVLRADELDTTQSLAQLLKVLAWVLPILSLALFAFAAWLARDRRRVVRRMGFAIFVTGVVGLVAVGLVGNYVVDSLASETDVKEAAGNAWDILSDLLRRSFWWMLPIGIAFVGASWLAGMGRRARGARRFLAPALRERVWPYLALGLVGVLLLLTSPVSDAARYLVVLVLLALGTVWIEVMHAQTMKEFPDASRADTLDELRTRLTEWWNAARKPTAARSAAPTGSGADLTGQLVSLSALHASGELTDEEYAAAKARVLGSD